MLTGKSAQLLKLEEVTTNIVIERGEKSTAMVSKSPRCYTRPTTSKARMSGNTVFTVRFDEPRCSQVIR
jgi:hypothetical protein